MSLHVDYYPFSLLALSCYFLLARKNKSAKTVVSVPREQTAEISS